jgi:hypothetical protein
LNKQEVIRQHYVPRFYLDRFANEKGFLKVYKKQEKRFKKGYYSPKSHAFDEYFYDISPEFIKYIAAKFLLYIYDEKNLICTNMSPDDDIFNDKQYVENYFKRTENDVANLFTSLDSNPILIHNEKNKMLVSLFLYDLYARTEGIRKIISQRNKKLDDNRIKEAHLSMIFDEENKLETMKNLCVNYSWNIGINETEANFIISDNPAFQIQNLNCNEVCIPISRKMAIMLIRNNSTIGLLDYPDENGIINLSYDNVVYHNGIQIGGGYKYVFGDEPSIYYGVKMFNLLEKRRISSNLIRISDPLKTVFFSDEKEPLCPIALVSKYMVKKENTETECLEIITHESRRVFDYNGELIYSDN